MRLYTIIILSLVLGPAMAADDFGRLFTTPEQRRALDAVRYQKETVQVEIPNEQEMAGGEDTAREPVAPIRLRGLVYRKDGRSAAWINDASTLKGDLSLEDIQVDTDDISSGQVSIKLPTEDRTIQLRVGDQYLPSSGQKIELSP